MPKGYTRIEPGVYRAPERNYWVRATACHPRTGRRINLSASLPLGATPRDARSRLAELRAEFDADTAEAGQVAAGIGQPALGFPAPHPKLA